MTFWHDCIRCLLIYLSAYTAYINHVCVRSAYMCLWVNFIHMRLLSKGGDYWWGMKRIRNTLGREWDVSRRVALAQNTTASHIITLIPLMRTTLRAGNSPDTIHNALVDTLQEGMYTQWYQHKQGCNAVMWQLYNISKIRHFWNTQNSAPLGKVFNSKTSIKSQ